MTYILSDIHGQMRRFQSVMRQINLQPEDTLYVLGDVIDRHSDGIKILRQLMAMPNVKLLLGNHEFMMLNSLYYPAPEEEKWPAYYLEDRLRLWYNNGGKVTHDYLKRIRKSIRTEIFEFLDKLPVNCEVNVNGEHYLLTHAAPACEYPKYAYRYDSERKFCVWQRYKQFPILEGKTVIFGHTPTNHYTKNGVYWVGRTLPTMVLMALQTYEKSFVYHGYEYQVMDFVPYKGIDKYLRIIRRFCNPSLPQTVFVFAQKNILRFKTAQYEEVTAMIPCADRSFPVPVTVYYDKRAQKYFINEETYVMTRKAYGLPYLRLQTNYGNTKSNHDFGTLKQQSELNLMGYNVSITAGLSVEERRKILRDAIDSGVLWKRDVINHLEWLIHTRAHLPNMENAVGEWKQDLIYISRYKSEEQRKIWVNKFKSRFFEKTIV